MARFLLATVAIVALLCAAASASATARYAKLTVQTAGTTETLDGTAYYSLFGNTTSVTGRLVAEFASTSRRAIHLIDACSYFVPSREPPRPWIALVSRGSCKFVTKASWAARAGAAAVIVVDNTITSQPPPIMAGTTRDDPAAARIVSVAISYAAGRYLVDNYLEQDEAVTISISDGGAVSEESQHQLSNTWFLGHIIIFAGTILLVSIVVLSTYYCRSRREIIEHVQQRRDTEDILKRMPTRRFSSLIELGPTPSPEEFPTCAVCLEDFEDGVELRVLPCKHEFHQSCVDPWLEEHHTCPLCKGDILTTAEDAASADEDDRLVVPHHRRRATEPDLETIHESATDAGQPDEAEAEAEADAADDDDDDFPPPLQFLGTESYYEPSNTEARRQHSRILRDELAGMEYLSVDAASSARASPTLV